MKALFLLLLVFVCSFLGYSQNFRKTSLWAASVPRASSQVNTLPIRRVILYSNGVAYIERRGTVSGKAEINLSFKQSQVDDVLKSMVVVDLGQGKIGKVSYNSSRPASARTAEIPFAIDSKTSNDGGISEVLSQIQGDKVLVTTAKGSASGSILTVQEKTTPGDKDSLPRSSQFLVIASETGEILSFDLAEVRSIKMLDDGTKRDISEFSNATASTRRRDAKTISVTSVGSGEREMVVSYTISAPIWKTTYRVVLDDTGKPFFQGWAIVDNVGDEDWENVQLSLVSGSPVSFIQNLQKPLYRYRPIIPIPEDLKLRPQIYDPESPEENDFGSGDGNGNGTGSGSGGGIGPPPPAASKPIFGDANSNFMLSTGLAGSGVSDALINKDGGVETAAIGEEIGNLFEYKIESPVSITKNQSALIPIIQTKMEGERVSIFRLPANEDEDSDDEDEEGSDESASVKKANPRAMSGLLLKNTSAMTFEGGSMTILDHDAYAGEALMERLKPKEQRLISFALDLGTLIRVDEKEDREPAKVVKVVDGVLQIHYFNTDKKIYKLYNQTDKPKIVYIEHPVRKNWILSENYAKPDYTTARYYRFRIELPAFSTKEITVGENLGMMDKYTLATFSPKDLDLFIVGRYIDEATKARLSKLINLRMKINDINARLEASSKESEEITTDQERFRENIEALAKTPDAKQLIARYIAKANTQESRLEQITTDKRALEAERINLERELALEIKNFEIK